MREKAMGEPTIKCPKCRSEIKLTESLVAPMLESTRRKYESRLAQKDAEIASQEGALRKREEALSKAKENMDLQVAKKIQSERAKIIAEEAKKAKLVLAADLEHQAREILDLQEVLKQRDLRLAEAQKAQVDLIRKQRELDAAKREFELTVEKRVEEGLSGVREVAQKEAEGLLNLKILEKEQTIAAMQKQIEDLRRRAEQGSQQLQGEVLELEIETLLREKFPRDAIIPVPKGEHGGDLLHRVVNSMGQHCGTILWECKRTKNWSDAWLTKLREDQRTAKAEIALIVSQALPKGVDTFESVENVWISHPKTALSVAMALRQTLIEIASVRKASEGQQTKVEVVYQYLTGPRFRQRVQAIVEAFSSMKEDLDKEKKIITKQWAKREVQIEGVVTGTLGLYGDLQGIAGKSLQEIEGLEFAQLEDVSVRGNPE